MNNFEATISFYDMSEQEFVREIFKGLKSPVEYNFHDAKINQHGPFS